MLLYGGKPLLLLIDLQEKLLRAMADPEGVLARAELLAAGALALDVPVLVSEQYPAGLGPTVPQLKEVLDAAPDKVRFFEKGAFSLFADDAIADAITKSGADTLILAGVEAHVCVRQTALDALNRGFKVALALDAAGSRRENSMLPAVAELRHAGVTVLDAEAILFDLLHTSRHPAFKTISKLVK